MSLTMNTFYSSKTLQWAMCLHQSRYHEIKLYDLITFKSLILDIRQYFVENWKLLLDDYEILLNIGLIKPDDLLTVLNSVNNDIQFSMELNDNKLVFLDIIITKSGKKFWMKVY